MNDNDEIINDATEVIRWYQFQIAAKIARALMYRADEEDDADEKPNDIVGSAKVALIAIDRSISAWRIMQFAQQDRTESITPVLDGLERLRKRLERTFPGARDFIRPGFDETPDDFVN